MFTLTPAAAARILDSAQQSDAEGMALRVAAKLEDDGQLSFGLGQKVPRGAFNRRTPQHPAGAHARMRV